MGHLKTRIGISSRITNAPNYEEKRDAVSHDWIHFLEKLDAIPVFIPNALSDVQSFLIDMEIDYLILSGGDNMGDDHKRDRTEKEIIDFGINHKIPIFGVCRGMQVLNKYFEGSMIVNGDPTHVNKPHLIHLTNETFSKSLHTNLLKVNSYHSNIIKKEGLGKDLEIFALSNDDKTIEGFFHKYYPIIGVMWHPERDVNIKSERDIMKVFQNKVLWNKSF